MMIKSRLLTVAVVALLLSGCSGIRLAYNTADFFIERYADDYLGLHGAQMERWSPTLKSALARHRQQELPYLAAFFNSAQNDARKGFTESDVACLLDQFEVIYRRHFSLASQTAAPLLAGLDELQVDALERSFQDDAREDAEDDRPANRAKQRSKRAERYEENMQWWIGDLNATQRTIVSDVTFRMPETGTWYRYRDGKRRELIALLRAGASAPHIERFLRAWLVEYQGMPQSLERARAQLRAGFTELLVRLDASLDEAQRRKLIDRLTKLRGDFMSLQRDPQMAPVAC